MANEIDFQETDGIDFIPDESPAPSRSAGASQQGISFGLPGVPRIQPEEAAADPRASRATLAMTASVLAPEALLAAVPGLSPAAATGVLGYLGRLGLVGATSGAAGATTSEGIKLAADETTVPEAAGSIAKQTALSAGVGVIAGPVLGKIANTVAGAVAAGPGNRGSGAILGLMRPLYDKAADAAVSRAATLIEEVTGIRPPQSLGEALGKSTFLRRPFVEIEKELGNEAAGAISDEARNALAKSVLHTATGLFGSGASKDQIAELTVAALQKEIRGNINEPAKKAIREFAESLQTALQSARGSAAAEGFGITRPTTETTPYVAGNIGKMAESEAEMAFKARENELYSSFRDAITKSKPKIALTKATSVADDILEEGLKTTTPQGQIVPMESTIPDAQARAFLNKIKTASNTLQDVDDVRKFRTQVSDAIGQGGVLSSLANRNKIRIAEAIKQDIDSALDALPDKTARDALKAANQFRFENIDKFKLPMSVKAGAEVTEGGTTSQNLFRSVINDPDRWNVFKQTLGNQFGVFRDTARDAILTEAQSAARPLGGEFSVAKAFKAIDDIPPEIRADVFPEFDKLRSIAAKELKASGLLEKLPKDPDAALEWMQASRGELDSYLGTGGLDRFRDAVRAKAAAQAQYRNSVLAEVNRGISSAVQENPVKFVDSLLGGSFKPSDVGQALAVVARQSPKTYNDIQVEYLSRLLENSSVKGIVSGDQLAKHIAAPLAGASPSSGGKASGLALEILGPAKVDALRTISKALGDVQKPLLGKEISARGDLMEILTSGNTPVDILFAASSKLFGVRSMRWISDIISTPAKIKYHIAAKFINDPQLFPLLTKPMEKMTGAEATIAAEALLQGMSGQDQPPK